MNQRNFGLNTWSEVQQAIWNLEEQVAINKRNADQMNNSLKRNFMGDWPNGNYTEWLRDGVNDGFQWMYGDARPWEDLRVPLIRAKVAGNNQPTFSIFKNGVYAYEFVDNDEIFFLCQIPHSWAIGGTIYPHLHWSPSTDVNPSDNIGIGLEYTWADIGDDFGATTTITRDVPTGVNNAYNHLFHDFNVNGIDGSGMTEVSSILVCRFFRQAAVADNYAASIFGLEVDFHYQSNTFGSRDINYK